MSDWEDPHRPTEYKDLLLLDDGSLFEVRSRGELTDHSGWSKTTVRKISVAKAARKWRGSLEHFALSLADLFAPDLAMPVHDRIDAEAEADESQTSDADC